MKKLLLAPIIIILIIGNIMAKERPWKTGEFDYEGFPLHLRIPTGLNYDNLSKKYPQFISITHVLSNVKNNGLPESEYNYSLIDFDGEIINLLEKNSQGLCVLVETFGGKRTYYMYASTDTKEKELERYLNKTYPSHKLELSSNIDKEWSFIRRYSKDWGF